jgi:DNA-binding winged helix-turn-helix (wHTH) protein
LAKGIAEEGSISASGSFVGTPGYASPEQFAGVGADIRSDLYSLGIVLWEMLSSELPFQGTNSELVYQHQHASLPVDRLAGVPHQVVPLLETLLEKDPALRFQTPNDLLKALVIVTDSLDSGHRLTKDELRSKVPGAVSPSRSTLLSPGQRDKRRRNLAMTLSFGPFVLDEEACELLRDGQPVSLQPRALELLLYLVRNCDRTVSKDELLDTLWPNVTVTDASIERAVSLVRSELRKGGCEKAIQTRPKLGYRFVLRHTAALAGDLLERVEFLQ